MNPQRGYGVILLRHFNRLQMCFIKPPCGGTSGKLLQGESYVCCRPWRGFLWWYASVNVNNQESQFHQSSQVSIRAPFVVRSPAQPIIFSIRVIRVPKNLSPLLSAYPLILNSPLSIQFRQFSKASIFQLIYLCLRCACVSQQNTGNRNHIYGIDQ